TRILATATPFDFTATSLRASACQAGLSPSAGTFASSMERRWVWQRPAAEGEPAPIQEGAVAADGDQQVGGRGVLGEERLGLTDLDPDIETQLPGAGRARRRRTLLPGVKKEADLPLHDAPPRS